MNTRNSTSTFHSFNFFGLIKFLTVRSREINFSLKHDCEILKCNDQQDLIIFEGLF